MQLNKKGIQIGLPANMLKLKYVEEYYSTFSVMRYNFFHTILTGVTFLQENMQKRLMSPQEEYKSVQSLEV